MVVSGCFICLPKSTIGCFFISIKPTLGCFYKNTIKRTLGTNQSTIATIGCGWNKVIDEYDNKIFQLFNKKK